MHRPSNADFHHGLLGRLRGPDPRNRSTLRRHTLVPDAASESRRQCGGDRPTNVHEVTAQIGAGGMDEVYRATDSNLKRSVAIKVLPASVAGDAYRADDSRIGIHLISVSKLLRILMPQRLSSFVRM